MGGRELRLAGRLRRLFPKLRGQLMVRAWRTEATVVEWSALRAVEGFGPLEEDTRASQGFTRRLTFPFRVTGARAGFEVPLPSGAGPALVSLVVANPDGEAPPLRTVWTLDGAPAASLELGVSARPVRVHLFVPEAVAARGAVRVELSTPTWRDSFRGREVGLHVGAQWVLTQRLAGAPAIDAAIARVRAERRAEESLEGWWVAAQGLYLPHRTLPGTLELGPGDEDQLGPGWFGREAWGKLGAMRWTGGRAEAYLGHAGRADRAVVRAYSGEPRLGPVTGRLVVERMETDGRATPAGEAPFSLAPDTWAELAVPFQAAPGLRPSHAPRRAAAGPAGARPRLGRQPRARARDQTALAGALTAPAVRGSAWSTGAERVARADSDGLDAPVPPHARARGAGSRAAPRAAGRSSPRRRPARR